MKKVLSLLSIIGLVVTMSSASNQAKMLKANELGVTGGIIGDTAIYIYHKELSKKINEDFQVEQLKQILIKKVCNDKSTRRIIEESKIKAMFVYNKNEKDAIVVSIDNCEGVPTK